MADTSVQREAEAWVCRALARRHGRSFAPQAIRLTPGGTFDCDAVSKDGTLVACISTSARRTASGKVGSGKVHKIRSDMLFLVLARDAKRRLAAFTEPDMLEFWEGEQENGRLPRNIKLVRVKLPRQLAERLRQARLESSREQGSRT